MITTAAVADLPELAALMAASELLARYRITAEGALDSLTDARESGDLLLVNREPELNAMAWVTFAPRMLNGAAYLRLLLVAHGSQSAGLGAALMDAVESYARERANHLYLLATTDNTRARRFYEARGFRHVGDLPGLVLPELDEALYYKTVRGSTAPAS
jgi:GNAT superfamily N-acetyltransferase